MVTEERRAPGAPRIPFQGLVEVGGAIGTSFEAQAVDVSEEGIHVKTTYLPDLGQELTCRFETSPGNSVLASGEVVWSRGAAHGGEFAIRFTEVDPESVQLLKRVCGCDAPKTEVCRPGSKVRLYIDGLTSPMRARVRSALPSAITVGSELGFLQVGKRLELEESQGGSKRPANIDRVEVAVDPTSNVPELVVTLRYTDGQSTATASAPLGRESNERSSASHDSADDMAAFDPEAQRMKSAVARQAARIGPAVERLVTRARTTLALLTTRGRGADEEQPRRTTAPAPGGGLHTSGRRVVRGESRPSATGVAPDAPTARSKSARRRWAVTAGVLAATTAGAVLIKKLHHEPAPVADHAVASDTAAVAAGGPGLLADAGATPVANTLAAAPLAPAARPASPSDPTPAATTASGAPPAATDTTGDDGTKDAAKKHVHPAPFSNGPVRHAIVLHLKMDGPVESIEGAQQPVGFTVKLPGRRSLEAAAPLAARDSRIAVIKVTNEPSGAELNVTFKDGVPNYQVSARGETLVIRLAPAGAHDGAVADREQTDKTSKRRHHHHHGQHPTAAAARDTTPER